MFSTMFRGFEVTLVYLYHVNPGLMMMMLMMTKHVKEDNRDVGPATTSIVSKRPPEWCRATNIGRAERRQHEQQRLNNARFVVPIRISGLSSALRQPVRSQRSTESKHR